eukprot:CAMPEP_0183732056 /NCGR_PEP_ID=MMETSP0737-20130205/37368_1 /TAXON_ID=385413 /ORGANISM="Thalassiosira miniscula, Strain CCMP1093" /LENGTH=184 /DNA_ID=CAMNT_0025964961 /DNA_START=55 /DNA_END=609 /DNA_ORIENTATION=+
MPMYTSTETDIGEGVLSVLSAPHTRAYVRSLSNAAAIVLTTPSAPPSRKRLKRHHGEATYPRLSSPTPPQAFNTTTDRASNDRSDTINSSQQGSDITYNVCYAEEGPLSWKEALAQPFLSCGLCQDDLEEKPDSARQMEETMEGCDWPTLLWHLSGLEFLRLSCIEPEVMDAFVTDKIVITGVM